MEENNEEFKIRNFVELFLAVNALRNSYVDVSSNQTIFVARMPQDYDIFMDSLLIEEIKNYNDSNIIRSIMSHNARNVYLNNGIFEFNRDTFADNVEKFNEENNNKVKYLFGDREIQITISTKNHQAIIERYSEQAITYMENLYSTFEKIAQVGIIELRRKKIFESNRRVELLMLELNHELVLPKTGIVKVLTKTKIN